MLIPIVDLPSITVEELQGSYFDFSKALELGSHPDADKYFNRGLSEGRTWGVCKFAIDDYTKAIELDKT
jgi:hypothetical protein